MDNALIPQDITIDFDTDQDITFNFDTGQDVNFDFGDVQIGGDYPPLTNKPKINGVTLVGNKLDSDLYLQHEMDEITFQDIDNIIYG